MIPPLRGPTRQETAQKRKSGRCGRDHKTRQTQDPGTKPVPGAPKPKSQANLSKSGHRQTQDPGTKPVPGAPKPKSQANLSKSEPRQTQDPHARTACGAP